MTVRKLKRKPAIQVGLVKQTMECPGRESNPHLSLRSALFYPLNYQGGLENYSMFIRDMPRS